MPRGNLRRFDLNLLVALDALLRTRNVTRAGEQLSLTQSAMSGELRRLRQMFGDELLIRRGREYALTALARDLIEPLAEILGKIERTLDHQPSFDPATESRHFSVVMSDYAALVLLQPLLRWAAKEAPGMSVSVFPFSSTIERTLIHDGVDLVICPAFDLEGVQSQQLFSERYVCVVAADHPDVGDHLTVDQFESLPRLTVAWRPRRRIGTAGAQVSGSDWSDSEFAAVLGPQPMEKPADHRIEVTTESFMLAPFLVSGTRLVGLVPERLANQFRNLAGVRVLPPPTPLPALEETMYWSAVAENDPAHSWLRQAIADIASDLA
jgi:LysR family transcriptional regulator, nod-box dependent transcriptional activator